MSRRGAVLAVVCAFLFLPRTQAAEEQVVLDIRLVSVAEPFFERIGIDFEATINNSPGRQAELKRDRSVELQNLGLTFLDDTQVFHFMEAIQGDRRSNVIQLPRLTLVNEQPGTLECTETKYFLTNAEWVSINGDPHLRPKNEPFKIGNQIWVRPTVSADRRHVQLALKVQQTELTGPTALIPVQIPVRQRKGTEPAPEVLFQLFLQQPQLSTLAIEKTVNVPSGRTVVMGGLKKTIETRTESSLPVLSRVPYVNRLFRNVGYGQETTSLLVFVTPRIVVEQEASSRTAAK